MAREFKEEDEEGDRESPSHSRKKLARRSEFRNRYNAEEDRDEGYPDNCYGDD